MDKNGRGKRESSVGYVREEEEVEKVVYVEYFNEIREREYRVDFGKSGRGKRVRVW